MTLAALSLLVSALSLGVSVATAWFTQLRRGRLAMTRPSVVHLGFDASQSARESPAKVYLRMLLYSTAVRGQAVERLYVRLSDEMGRMQVFGAWFYRGSDGLTPGSGLYVPSTGVVLNHHFVLGEDRVYPFSVGKHTIEVFAKTTRARTSKLAKVEVRLSETDAAALAGAVGVLFSSDPETGRYQSQTDVPRDSPVPPPEC